MNLPPQIIGMPPLSVPPPQQQFTAVPTVQQPQNVDQPMLINNNPSDPVMIYFIIQIRAHSKCTKP